MTEIGPQQVSTGPVVKEFKFIHTENVPVNKEFNSISMRLTTGGRSVDKEDGHMLPDVGQLAKSVNKGATNIIYVEPN